MDSESNDFKTPFLQQEQETSFIDYKEANSYEEDDELFQTLLETGGYVLPRHQTQRQESKLVPPDEEEDGQYIDVHDVEFANHVMNHSASSTSHQEINRIPILNMLSVGNALSCFWSWSVTFGISPFVKDAQTPLNMLRSYQSLLTPADYTYTILIPIVFFEIMLSIAQFHSLFRASALVRDGIGIYFFYSNIAQSVLVILFCMNYIFVAFIFAVYMMIFHTAILFNQYCFSFSYSQDHQDTNTSHATFSTADFFEYWCLKFPIALKCGWIYYSAGVIFSASLVEHSESASTQLTAATMIFVILVAISLFFLIGTPFSKPSYVIPLVLVWSLFGTFVQLRHPKDHINSFFGDEIISSVRESSLGCCVLIMCLFVPRVCISWIHRTFTIDISTF